MITVYPEVQLTSNGFSAICQMYFKYFMYLKYLYFMYFMALGLTERSLISLFFLGFEPDPVVFRDYSWLLLAIFLGARCCLSVMD